MSSSIKIRTWFPLTVASLTLCFCTSDSGVTYSPERDLQALRRIEHAWSGYVGGSYFSIELCEDIEANLREGRYLNEEDGGCMRAHLVRSEYPAREWTHTLSGSCADGGCPFSVETYVKAVITVDGGKTIQAHGIVELGSSRDDNPYEEDYNLTLYRWSDDCRREEILLSGNLLRNGKFHIYARQELRQYGVHVDRYNESFEVLYNDGPAHCGQVENTNILEENDCEWNWLHPSGPDAGPEEPEQDAGIDPVDEDASEPVEDDDAALDAGEDDPEDANPEVEEDSGTEDETDAGDDDAGIDIDDDDAGTDPGEEDEDASEPVDDDDAGEDEPEDANTDIDEDDAGDIPEETDSSVIIDDESDSGTSELEEGEDAGI